MNISFEIFNMSWMATLGWSLLHSLWQGAFVLLITLVVLRFVPDTKSNWRYAIALAALSTIILLFAGTLMYLEFSQPTADHPESLLTSAIQPTSQFVVSALPETIPSAVYMVVEFINLHIHKIFTIWLIGVALLFTRLAGSFWYIEKIRNHSSLLSGTVLEHLNKLAYQMQIPRWIDLAENTSIHSPMVIGILKPIILVPAGMLAGLSAEQVELIFIHELTHIKRHDYLVNLIQATVEVILFFNPFVLVLSELLRKERENCCDDVVLNRLKNPALYYLYFRCLNQ